MNPSKSVPVQCFSGASIVCLFSLGSRSVMLADRTTTTEYYTVFVNNLAGEPVFGAWEDDSVTDVVFAMLENLFDNKMRTCVDVNFSAYHPESHYSLLAKTDPSCLRDFLSDQPPLCPAGPLSFVLESKSIH